MPPYSLQQGNVSTSFKQVFFDTFDQGQNLFFGFITFFALGLATVNWLFGGCTWPCFGIQKANLSGVSGDTVVTRVVSKILFYFPRFVGR